MIGKTISHYKIIEKLGSGGMGVVYRALDTKLDRLVALKFLPPHLTHAEEEKNRFIHEAKAASALDHPNICTVHEIGETEDGQMFIVMACYDGESLKDRIASGPLPIDEIIEIILQVAQGLAKAHALGIVHRDIKPANVLLTDDGQVKIVDFGLAKLTGRTMLTKEGTTLGTVAYMSPEQTEGKEVDQRTDIWALGVVLYEMLSGEHPFKGDYEQAVIYSIVQEDPPPVNTLGADIPEQLAKIVHRTLEKEPKSRFASCDDLINDLRTIQYVPIALSKRLRQPRFAIPAVRPAKKAISKPHLILFGVGLLLALAIMLFSLNKPNLFKTVMPTTETTTVSQWENSIAVLPFKNISPDPEQEYFCDGMTEQIITNLSQLQNLKVIARTSVMKFKDTQKTIPEIATELGVAHLLEGSIRKAGNQIRVTAQLIQAAEGHHLWAKDYDRELKDIFAVQDDISEEIGRSLVNELLTKEVQKIQTNQSSSVEAYEYYMKGRHYHTKFVRAPFEDQYFDRAVEMLENAVRLDPNYALAYSELADLYNSYIGMSSRDKEKRQKSFEMQQKYIDLAFELDPNLPDVHRVKGFVFSTTSEIEKALHSFRRALEMNPNDRRTNFAFGHFFVDRGLYHQAIKYLSKAFELDPLDPFSYTVCAICYVMTGDFDKAILLYHKALEVDPNYFLALGNMARTLIMLRRYDEAESLLEKASSVDPDAGGYKILKALLFAAQGKKDDALKLEFGGAFSKSIIYLQLGMKEEAITQLRERQDTLHKRLKDRERTDYLHLKNLPWFDSLRDDIRFKEILEQEKKVYDALSMKYGKEVRWEAEKGFDDLR